MTFDEEIKAARRRIVWHWIEGAEKMGIDPETGQYWWQRGKQSARRCDTLQFVAKWFLRRGYHPDREQSKAQLPVDLLATADAIVCPAGV